MEYIRKLDLDEEEYNPQCPHCHVPLSEIGEQLSEVYEGNGLYQMNCPDIECGLSFKFTVEEWDINIKVKED